MLKIKVVHVIGSLGRGGAERYVVDLCNEIANVDKYEVFIVSLCANQSKTSFIDDISPKVTYVTLNKSRGFSLSAILKITNWLREESPHIVHTHLNAYEYLYLYRLYRSRASFFHTIHNIAEAECPNYAIKYLRKLSYRNNSVIPVTISYNGSKTYRHYYGIYNDITIPNGRPPLNPTSDLTHISAKYKSSGEGFLLLNVGNISAQKNQALLIESVQKYNSREKNKCHLLILGDVKSNKVFSDLKVLVGDDPYIEFLGGNRNVAEYLSLADAFCLSSAHEGMPISLIEAMSLGCIPICTPVGGVKEMIRDGETGFLSKNLSVEAYYRALKRALDSPIKSDIANNIKTEYMRKYHINIAAQKHLKTYNNALNLFEGNDNAFELLYKSKVLNTNQ